MITALAIIVWLISVIGALRLGVRIGRTAASQVFWDDHDERIEKMSEPGLKR